MTGSLDSVFRSNLCSAKSDIPSDAIALANKIAALDMMVIVNELWLSETGAPAVAVSLGFLDILMSPAYFGSRP
jgi:hypothetical protein